MEKLPAEIILNVTNYLTAQSITRLNLVSQHFHRITRDNELWKKLCFNESHFPASQRRDPSTAKPVPERTIFALQRAVARSNANLNQPDASSEDSSGLESAEDSNDRRTRSTPLREDLRGGGGIASWDPTIPGEKVDWHSEYIARHAPLSLDWLQQPAGKLNGSKEKLEIRGVGLLNESVLLAPLDDGSVCFWNIDQDSTSWGNVTARSRPGFLSFDNGKCGREWQKSYPSFSKIRMPSTGVVENVSIDRGRDKAYFAVQSGLNEIDLTTLKVTAYDRYPQPISVLSTAQDPTPLTVGTTQAIHIHDPRVGQNSRTPTTSISKHMRQHSDFYRIHASDPDYAVLSQPLPLSIIHRELDMIHVAGRFPSILTYDRRFFPQVASTIHSGARLSCIISIPSASGSTIAAAGEYNGKGSLEIYPLSSPYYRPVGEAIINRTSTSSSKCLSLTDHGTRLLFSDSDGILKWVERDGSTLVRRWNINTHSTASAPGPVVPLNGIFNAERNEGEVARKLLPVNEKATSDICVWTGERVGILSSGRKDRVVKKKGDEVDGMEGSGSGSGSGSEGVSDDERVYGSIMRRALERQADEVRFVRGLGMGRSF
ncbi:MAG: hypothetical protein Q9217_003740 [Psora testacea]